MNQGKRKVQLTGWWEDINSLIKNIETFNVLLRDTRIKKKARNIVECLALSLERQASSFDFVAIHCVFFLQGIPGNLVF